MPQQPPPGTTPITDLSESDAWEVLNNEGLKHQRPRFVNHPDVWGLEVGVREEKGRVVEPREPCLKLYVYRKGAASEGFEIDPWTTVQTAAHGRVAFRTDVEPLGVFDAQVNRVPAPEVEAETKAGSGFYVVEVAGRRYLLSAAHVFQALGDGGLVRWRKAERRGRGRFVKDRRLYWPRWEDPEERTGWVDLGLAQVAPNSLGPYRDPTLVPQGDGVVSWGEAPTVDLVTVCGKHGMRNARFSGRVPTGLLVPAGGNSIRYWRLLSFRLLGGATQEGDSGAPIIDVQGRLVGMHVVRRAAKNPRRFYSLALSAGDLVRGLGRAFEAPVTLLAMGVEANA